MLDHESGVHAVIAPYDSEDHYREWKAPADSPLHSGNEKECYIEAVTDQRFIVRVTLPTTFDFKGASHVKVGISIDNGTVRTHCMVKNTQPWTKPVVEKFTAVSKAIVGSGYKLLSFTFGKLSLREDVELTQDEERMGLRARCKIVVTIRRGEAKSPKPCTPNTMYLLPDQTNKIVAVNNGKSHSLKLGDLGPATGKWTYQPFFPLKGETGNETTFAFFYTSRMFLEIKKVIPISPISPLAATPKAKPMLMPSRKEHPKREIIEISDDCDDKEQLMAKTIKSEATDGHSTAVTSHQAPSIPTDTNMDAESQNIKTEIQNEQSVATTDSEGLQTTEDALIATKEGERAKKRAKLLLDLEEVKIRKQLLALDETDEG